MNAFLGSADGVATATTTETVIVDHELTGGDGEWGSLFALRSGPDLLRRGPLGMVVRGAGAMIFCHAHATRSFLTGFNIHWLSALSVTPISSGPPLKIREQLSPDCLIPRQIPKIPGTELSWGWCKEEMRGREPLLEVSAHKWLFWTVLVLRQQPGRNECLCFYNKLPKLGHHT